jgi:hypothetical protein
VEVGERMANHDKPASRNIVWQMNIPETVLDLYFNHVRMLPSWKVNFPNYVHPAIRGVVELAPNETKIITETGEYVFVFDERSTFVLEAADFVKTGILEIHYNAKLVLRLTISPSDSAGLGKSWVARGVEEFKDGEWVAELAQLDPQLAAHEAEQTKKDEALRQDELKGVAELKEKLSKLPPAKAEEPSWFRRLLRHSGI